MARWLGGLVSIALATAGCQADGFGLDWQYRFADDAQRSASQYVVAQILEGGCSSVRPIFIVGFPRDEPSPMDAPQLGPGRWGFEVVARNADCTRVARGCVDVDLPDGDRASVVVDLASVTGAVPECPASQCSGGDCMEFDAGLQDTGTPVEDTGTPDTMGPDTTVPPSDSGPPGCGTCPTQNSFGHCEGTMCVLDSCESGYEDCNGAASDGCEETCPSAPNLAPECYREEGCVRGGCVDGYSDCDGVTANGCETDGRCTCPPTGPCVFDCANGCSVICDRDCTVRCGSCTYCAVTCGADVNCTIECTPGSISGIGGLPIETTHECELFETCG
jgi:hypothetical protein